VTILRAQVILGSDSALPKDVSVNTFHFDTTVPYDTASAQSVIDRLRVFYNAIKSDLSQTLNPALCTVKIYDLSDIKPRVPREHQSLNLDLVGNSSHPREVALVLSFEAARQSGSVQRRRRNRVYLGPLSVIGTVSGADFRPPTALLDEIASAAGTLKANASLGIQWVIRSQVGNFVAPVANGWLDNAFDTQRRRGADPTSRSTF